MTASRRAAVPAGYGPEDWPDYDLGALRLSAPPTGALGLADSGTAAPDAAYFTFPEGQVRVSVLAAPRGRPLWPDRAQEIAGQQAALGADVSSLPGEWGLELAIAHGGESNWVIGVDGPRWMLLGRATWPADSGDPGLVETMRQMLRGTRVNRGDEPYPVRAPLPLRDPMSTPEPVAEGRGPYAAPMTLVVRPPGSPPQPTLPPAPAADGAPAGCGAPAVPDAPAAHGDRAAAGSVVTLTDARPSRTAGRARAAALAAGTVLLLGLGAAALAMGISRPGDDPFGLAGPIAASSAPNGGAAIPGTPDAGRRTAPVPPAGSARDDALDRPQPRHPAGEPQAGTPGSPGGGAARQPAGGPARPGERPAPGTRHQAPAERKPAGGPAPAPARKPAANPGGAAGGPPAAARGRTAPGGSVPPAVPGPQAAPGPREQVDPGDRGERRDDADPRQDDDDTGDGDPADEADEPEIDEPDGPDPGQPDPEGPLGSMVPDVGHLLPGLR